jgi:alpha,alpha-trehalase
MSGEGAEPTGGPGYRAAILDMDGVLTRTVDLHARAWKAMFDEFLEGQAAEGEEFEPFDLDSEYRAFVDGKPRLDGARSFIESRGIELPEGDPEDPGGEKTLWGLGNRKNERFHQFLQEDGVEVFPGAEERVKAWRAAGLRIALVTSSRNGATVLEAAGLADLFDVVLEGKEAAELELPGKPAPDLFLEAARRLGVAPEEAFVVEDAVAGVQAARAGGFGRVVGVAEDGGEALLLQGADLVVQGLGELELDSLSGGTGAASPSTRPAMEHLDEVLERMTRGRLALFLDYDGTLTPIVRRPEKATLSPQMRDLLERLADCVTVAVVSGRDLADVQDKVGLENLQYAGSHGFDIAGPDGLRMQHEAARESLPELDEAEAELGRALAKVEGARVERKHFAIAVHYREVAEEEVDEVEAAVGEVLKGRRGLRKKGGKKIFELQPDVKWDKGQAVLWLLEKLELSAPDVLPVYIGDDVTDEDAFEALRGVGLGIRVGADGEKTGAHYTLPDTDGVEALFRELAKHLEQRETPARPHREMHPWELVYREWRPGDQPLREALCALGNGHLVTRGAFEERPAGGVHYPGTYLAGGYNRMESEVSGRVLVNEDLVNWPNWLPLTFRPSGGDWFDLEAAELLDFEVRLDVRRGLLTRRVEFRDGEGREFALSSRRLVSMALPHLAAVEWRLRPLNWSGTLEIRSALDGSVINDNVKRYRELRQDHLEILGSGWEGEDGMYLTSRTRQSRVEMTQAARTRVFRRGTRGGEIPAPLHRHPEADTKAVAHVLEVSCREGEELRVEKVVSIRTSRDSAISEPEIAARQDIRRAGTFDEILRDHETQWRHLWSLFDIDLQDGDVQTQLILRLHLFHLVQTVSIHSIERDIGVPARGWHGEAYRGHIFWDELFIFPLLVLRIPELARSLLMYRYRRLGEARHMARDAGYRGAMFPWQSGSDGREETQVLHLNPESGRWLPDTTHLQRHVNAAIVYNLWEYVETTDDQEFLAYYGAEMIVEIARFWASLATWDAERDRYVIRGVVGPDEFHTDDPNTEKPGLDNNAYTNVMAAWVLRCAGRALDRLDRERRRDLGEELELEESEVVLWDEISRKLLVPFHGENIISQFEGYERLKEFDWEGYRERHDDIHRLDRILEAEGDDVNRYKVSKQADVLMLFFLFSPEELEELLGHMGHEFTPEMIQHNVDYYMERTSHGSTLSRLVHAWVLARTDRRQAWSLWQEALRSDIEDVQGGTTQEGIHLGAMAGAVDLIHRGHAGLEMREDTLWFNPLLPLELGRVRMRMRYRGHWLTVAIEQARLTVTFDRGSAAAVRVGVCGEVVTMEQGESRTFDLAT